MVTPYLKEYLNKLKQYQFQFTEDFFWDIFFEMMCGVYYLHCLGFVHLDIKPTNFLVDEHGIIKLTDFCQSREINKRTIDSLNDNFSSIRSSLSSKSSFNSLNSSKDFNEGDSVYLAPEFFSNISQISYKTDIFSLGLSFYEILSGVSLPKNGDLWQKIRAEGINQDMLNSISFQNIRFRELISKMTAVNQEERWTIEMFLNNENFIELYQRFNSLKINNYHPLFDPSLYSQIFPKEDYENYEENEIKVGFAERSDSSMAINFNY